MFVWEDAGFTSKNTTTTPFKKMWFLLGDDKPSLKKMVVHKPTYEKMKNGGWQLDFQGFSKVLMKIFFGGGRSLSRGHLRYVSKPPSLSSVC